MEGSLAQRLAHLFIIQCLAGLIVDGPRRPHRSPRSQRMPRIQKELWNAQVVWNLWTFAMNGMEFMDRGNRSHLRACFCWVGECGGGRGRVQGYP